MFVRTATSIWGCTILCVPWASQHSPAQDVDRPIPSFAVKIRTTTATSPPNMPSKLFNKFTQSGYPRRSSYTEVSQSESSRLDSRSPTSSSSSSTTVGERKRSAVAWSLAAVGVILTFTNLLGAALYFAANRHLCDADVRLHVDDEKEGGYGFSLLPSRECICEANYTYRKGNGFEHGLSLTT